MKRLGSVILIAAALLACASGETSAPQIPSVHLSDLRARSEFYKEKPVDTECLLVDDGFETQWLMESLRILDHPPIPYSLSEEAKRDEAGILLLRSAMAKRRMALVTVRGRLTTHPHNLEPWRLEFVIDRILAASAVPKPNQALQPTRMLVTFRAYARPAPSTRVADL